MVFNSITFLIFLAVSAAAYYLLPGRWRNAFLLVASYVFYMWKLPQYGALVLAVTGASYAFARAVDKAAEQKKRKALFIAGLLVSLLALAVFKYYNFFMAELAALFSLFGLTLTPAALTLALPAGISFYTFTVVGYLIDVYHKKTACEKDFVTYALFVSFFPSVLMGPIARAGELLPQFKTEHKFEYSNLVEGLQRFLTGAFKKVVVADGLGIIVDGVYGDLANYRGLTLLAAVVFYALQLYCDFSGYTDMALGAARLLGFSLRENFKAPYLASTLGGFWSRWHRSLTDWLRDYIYIPLGGSRRGFPRKLFNILIVFIVSGLWHGAGVNFIVWGLWLAVWRIAEELILRARGADRDGPRTGAGRVLGAALTDLVVAAGWVFFRTPTLADALYVFKNCLRDVSFSETAAQLLKLAQNEIADSGVYYLFFFGSLLFGLLLTLAFDARTVRLDTCNPLATYKSGARWALYHAMSLLTIFFYFIAATGAAGPLSFLYIDF